MIYEQHTSLALTTIFSRVGEIGTPGRKQVRDPEEFLRIASAQHRSSPIFADVFDNRIEYDPRRKMNVYIPQRINKMFFDFDHPDQKLVEHDVEIVTNNLLERGISRAEIAKEWTTGKGDHLYAKIKPIINPTKEEVLLHQQKFRMVQMAVSQCHCSDTPHLLHSVDRKVFAEFSRVARVPGVQRPDNGKYPVVMDNTTTVGDWIIEHGNWDTMMEAGDEILWQWGSRRGRRSIDELIREGDEQFLYTVQSTELGEIKNFFVEPLLYKPNDFDTHRYLREFFEQAGMGGNLIEEILKPTADNDTRVAGGTCLLEFGLNPEVSANLLAMIGWHNFNYTITYKKLNDLYKWRSNKG